MASAPFSSPPAHPVSHTVNGAYADDCTFWATAALANDAKDSSPLVALNSICQVRANLTMSSERAIAEDDSEDGRKRALCIRTDISVDVQLKDGSAKNFSIVAGADLSNAHSRCALQNPVYDAHGCSMCGKARGEGAPSGEDQSCS